MRINQFVAASSSLSRRAADAAIASGRVTINGRPIAVGETVPDSAQVHLDGRLLAPPTAHAYVMLHKPAGYVSSRRRQGSDPTVYELLPAKFHHLRPVGRLDRDSTGLLLLSDDGDFIHRLTHPSFGKEKTYELTLARPLAAADADKLEAGVSLNDGPSRLKVLSRKQDHVCISLSEGRNRQLRRTFGALGYTVQELHRTAVGPYRLADLAEGAWREVPAL
jgi:23S rRNA pseudouridine2605 synthase